MLKANIAVLVSGGGTNLQALIDSDVLRSGKISLVISNNEDAYALVRAEKAGIKTAVVKKKGVEQAVFENELIKLLDENNIDFIILAGFMCILSESPNFSNILSLSPIPNTFLTKENPLE